MGKDGLIQPARKLIGLEIAVIDHLRRQCRQFHPEISVKRRKLRGYRLLIERIAPHGQHRPNPPETILLPEDRHRRQLRNAGLLIAGVIDDPPSRSTLTRSMNP